jgi:hypothetical protein
MSFEKESRVALLADISANLLTTTAQFGEPELTVIAPFIGGDLLYTAGVKQYVDDNYSGQQGLTDEWVRDVAGKTVVTTLAIWITGLFTGSGTGVIDGGLNALVSYTASSGVQELLRVE